MDERQSIPYALNHCSVRCTMRLPPFHTLGIGPSSLGHNAVPGNASPGHRTWHLTPCCRADRVRRKSSQIDLHPIMTSAPDRPPAIPGRLSLPWPLTSRDHGMCTHKHMYMRTRMNMCACTRRTPGITSKNTNQPPPGLTASNWEIP